MHLVLSTLNICYDKLCKIFKIISFATFVTKKGLDNWVMISMSQVFRILERGHNY
jgi:hypothetical protein